MGSAHFQRSSARVIAAILFAIAGAIGCSEDDRADSPREIGSEVHVGALIPSDTPLASTDGSDERPDDAPAARLSEGQVVTLTISDTAVVTIGGRDQRTDYQIVHNSGALRLRGGQLVLADDATRELRFYDSLGQHLRTAGGQGSGPGEFRRLRSIGRLSADTVFAWDMAQNRSSLFSPDGVHLRTANVPALPEIQKALHRRYPQHFVTGVTIHPLHTGSLLIEPLLEPNMEILTETQLLQDTILLYAIDRSGEGYVELGSFPGAERFLHERRGGRLPFGENIRIAATGDAVYVGATRDRVIRILSPVTAQVIGSIDLPLKARPPSREAIEQVRRRHLDRMPPALRSAAVSYMDAVPWPATMPFYSDFRVAADGRLWVQTYPTLNDEFQEWLIFEPAGRHVASVAIDRAYEILDAGADFVVTRVTGELDLQEIRVYRLTGKK